MKTSTLPAAVQSLALPKLTGLLLSFNFDKLHIQGQAQEVSVTNEGVAIKGDLYEVNKTIDFDAVNLEALSAAVLESYLDADNLIQLVDNPDREAMFCRMFKTVCSSQSLKALKAITGISEEEKAELDRLNRADTFVNDLLPRILCMEPVIRTKLSTGEVFNFEHFGLDASMFATGNKSTYSMSDNGGIKVYLLAEHKREFDDLVDAGLLDDSYGRNLVKKGDFAGCFAVLIPTKAK